MKPDDGQQKIILQDILEMSLAGYWDWNIPANTEYLSPTFKRMFGYEPHELADSPDTWMSLIFPDDLPGVLEVFNRHVESHGQQPYLNEVRYRHKNGSTVWVICAGRVIEWSDDGAPVRMVGCHIDITARKTAEEAIRKSEEQYRQLFAAMSLGAALHEIVCDDNGEAADYVTLEVNRKFEEILCVDREAVVGRKASEILPAPELAQWLGIFGPVALTGEPAQWETYSPVNEKHFEGTAYRPRPGQFVAMFSDISQRKEAEEAQRSSENIVRALLKNARAGIGYFTLDGKVILFNDLALENMGGGLDDFVGRSLDDLYGPEEGSEYLRRIRQAAASSQTTSYEDLVSLGSGDRWFSSHFTRILGQAGTVEGVMVVSHDITDLKNTQQQLERQALLLEEGQKIGSFGSWDWNFKTKEIWWSDGLFALYGIDPAEEPPAQEGDRWLETIHPDDRVRLKETLQRAISTGSDYESEHRIIRQSDREIRWHRATGKVLPDTTGKPERLVGVTHDVTDRVQAEIALRSERDLAQQYLRSILRATRRSSARSHTWYTIPEPPEPSTRSIR